MKKRKTKRKSLIRKLSKFHLEMLDVLLETNKKNLNVLDADEKSETPEFLRLFQTIGAANQNEAVVETAGAAPTRVAQRTSFETLKLRRNDTSTVESGSAPATTWKPKKKKTTNPLILDSHRDFHSQKPYKLNY